MGRDWLEKFLNIYWLRPENALWRASSCKVFEDLDFEQPSLDLSCGDGVFSFLLAGGDFGTEFDIFGATDNLDKFFQNKDIYNATTDDYDPVVTERPSRRMTVGTDWKQALLDKADALDFYEDLQQHDNNEPLPFADDRFQTIFSNSVYWVENVDLHLEEIARVLADNGQAHLVLKNTHVRDFLTNLWDQWENELGGELIQMIDRGRSDHYAHLYSPDGWKEKLEDAGLNVVQQQPTVTQAHCRMWDIGLRPISPYLIRMAYSMSSDQRVNLKKDWIETWHKMLEPFYTPRWDYIDRPAPEIVYTVSPN